MAAQDAELKLRVSLDLTSLRRQLNTVGTSLSGQPLYVPFKFDKKLIANEYRLLSRYISGKTFDVKIESKTLETLSAKVKNFQERLKGLEGVNIDIGIGAVKSLSKKDAQKIKTDLRQSILSEDKKIFIPVSIKSSITREDVRNFKNAVKSKLSGLSIDVKANVKGGGFAGSPQGAAGLMEFMQSQGMIGKIASGMEMRMKKGGDDLSRDLDDAVKSAEKIKATFDGIAKSIATTGKTTANVQGKRLGLGNVPLMSGSIERRIERAASSIAGTLSSDVLKLLYPEINKAISSFTALRGQVQQNASKLSGFSLIIGLAAFAGVPLAKSVVKLTGSANDFAKLLDGLGPKLESAFLKAASNILNASSTRLLTGGRLAGLLSPAAEPAGLLPPAYRGIGPSRNAGALPPAYRGIGPAAEPVGLLPSLSSAGQSKAIIEALIASTGPRLLPSGGGDDSLGKLAAPRQTKDAVDAILRDYFKVVEAQVKEVFSAPPIKKESLNIFDHLDTEQYFNYLAQARINAENAIRQSIEEAKQVTKQNRIKDAAQSFLRALETTVRNAERSIFLQSRIAANQSYVQKANIREIGQPLLGGRPVAAPKMLSAATGFYRGASTSPLPETQAQLFARREREARMRSALRSVDVMGETPTRAPARYSYAKRPAMPRRPTSAIVPYEGGGALVPTGGGAGAGVPPRPPSGGGGMGGAGSFGRALGGINLPGTGLVREIGDEFAMATKQVLLFGTAYKALAFLTSFPAQVGQAVGALQSFNNTLKAISPTADEARASNQFILDIVDRYNVPLQSARDGFTKLYASMAPAGFKGDEIRALFTGVSQAAATFGMSADKVDRVNYAFAQMASKGQVMSEELKGQLGDVLPGAMGIFAEAAGFTGPDAIQKFSKALEDGAYKGEAMRGLLKNVTVVLTKEFGPGAEGAARTFQGVINRMQNSTKLLYEAFEPVAVGFLNSVVVPLTSGIKTVTDGFNAFFTGQAAQTAGGSVLAKQLEALRPAFEGIAANIKQILPLLQSFASTALSLGQVLLQIAGNPFVGYLARIYLSVLPLTMALRVLNLQALIPLIGSFLRAIPAFISFNAAMMSGVGTNRALIATMQLTGQTAGITAGKIRLVSAAVATLGSAAILAGIGLLVERFMMMKGAIDGVRQSTQQMLGSISGMANSGAVRELKNVGQDLQKQRGTFEELRSFVSGGVIAGGAKRLTEAGAKKFEEVGMASFVKKDVFGKPYIADFLRASEIIEEKLKGLDKQSSKVQEKLPLAAKIAANLARQAQSAQAIAPIPGGDGAGKPPKEQSLESYYSLQDQLAKNFTQDQLQRMEKEYQARVDKINYEFDLREARANSFQKEAIRFERQMSDIELKRQKALLDASAEVIRAQGSVAGGAGGGKGLGAGIAQYITGDPSSPFYKGDHGGSNYHEHLAFVSREAAEEAYRKLTGAGIQVTEFKGKSRVGRHTPGSAHYEGLAFDVPGAQVPIGQETKLTARVQSILGIGGAGAPRKVTGNEKRDVIADQKTQLAIAQKSLAVQIAEAQAVRDAAVAWAQYSTSIAPIEEQKLQNSLLTKKNELVKSGLPDDITEKEIKQFEIQQKTALAVDVVNKMLADKKIKGEDAAKMIAELNSNMAVYNELLDDNLVLQRQQSFDASMGALQKQITMATPVGGAGLAAGFIGDAGSKYEEAIKEGRSQDEAARFAELQNQLTLLETRNGAVKSSVLAIGDAFATAMTTGVSGLIDGTATAQEVFANFLKSVADALMQAAQQMIATYIAIGIARLFAGLGSNGGSGMNSASALGTNPNVAAYAPLPPIGFAEGGFVAGPTMGLIGEGGESEYVIPASKMQSAMKRYSGGARGSAVIPSNGESSEAGAMPTATGGAIDVRYTVERINTVDYVTADQFQRGMQQAASQGAQQGEKRALRQLQQNTSIRGRVGLR